MGSPALHSHLSTPRFKRPYRDTAIHSLHGLPPLLFVDIAPSQDHPFLSEFITLQDDDAMG